MNTTPTSAKTSLNQIPYLFKFMTKHEKFGKANYDLGGGKFETSTEYLKSLGVTNLIDDRYNRTAWHNFRSRNTAVKLQAETITCSNVLNVVKTQFDRNAIYSHLKHMQRMCKADIYITVYEGDKTGNGSESKKDCWQNNRPLKSYLPELSKYFDNMTLKYRIIHIPYQSNKAKQLNLF